MLARSTSVRRQATPPSWLVLLAFAAASFLLLVALGETTLRLNDLRFTAQADPRCAGSDAAQASQKGLYIADAGAGYVMRRNACVRLRTAEYDEVLRTNGRGFVGPALPLNKATDELRIVVLGDSYTVGGQVPYEQTFPAVLEQELHARGYPTVRV